LGKADPQKRRPLAQSIRGIPNFLLTIPLYFILFLLVAGGAAVYYFQQVTNLI
jgi:hypothetical protein